MIWQHFRTKNQMFSAPKSVTGTPVALATVYPTLGCTCVQSSRLVYTVPLITEIDQITVVSHSVHILTYCSNILLTWLIHLITIVSVTFCIKLKKSTLIHLFYT